MGNFAKGATSESENVVAWWPGRNNLPETQSLKPKPAFSRGSWNLGRANAPSATSGVSFSNSRRFMLLNLRSSIREFVTLCPQDALYHPIGFTVNQKVTTGGRIPQPEARG